jgi:hypothetical protein
LGAKLRSAERRENRKEPNPASGGERQIRVGSPGQLQFRNPSLIFKKFSGCKDADVMAACAQNGFRGRARVEFSWKGSLGEETQIIDNLVEREILLRQRL